MSPQLESKVLKSLAETTTDNKKKLLGKFNSKYKDVIKLTGKLKKKK